MIIFKIVVLWLTIDIFILATVWYAATTIRPWLPQLWRTFICDRIPDSFDQG